MANNLSEVREARAASETIRSADEMVPGIVLRDRFELLEEIGRGGLSVVFRARDLVAARAGLSDCMVALKTIVADAETDPDIVTLLHREARRLRGLIHPNIVRVYDMDVDGDVHFMIMECLEGRTLNKALCRAEDGRLAHKQVLRLVADVSAGLVEAHRHGIVHADLKPANVFIGRDGNTKLIDFNIAHPVARAVGQGEEDTMQILGRLGAFTPRYASPQRLAEAEPCEADDVYSLAVLICVCLSGNHPFGGCDAVEAAEQNLQPVLPSSLSWARQRALKQALAFDDRDRTPTIHRFARSFASTGVRNILGLSK
jgi:serine/threonine protein kinase